MNKFGSSALHVLIRQTVRTVALLQVVADVIHSQSRSNSFSQLHIKCTSPPRSNANVVHSSSLALTEGLLDPSGVVGDKTVHRRKRVLHAERAVSHLPIHSFHPASRC